MLCRCKIIKQVYSNKNYQVYGCVPTQPSDVKLNKYKNFTIVGDLGMLEVGNEYTFDLEEGESTYGYQYKVLSIPSLEKIKIDDINKLDQESELEMLQVIMSDTQSKHVNKAYPNFIRLVMEGKEDEIDYRNIYNVGEVRIKSYIQKVNTLFKYFKIIQDNKQYAITYTEAVDLCRKYPSMKEAQKHLDQHPYVVLIDVLQRPFISVDKLLMDIRPELKEDNERCEFTILYFLHQNEIDGNTRIKGNDLAQYVGGHDRCLLQNMKEVSINSPRIFYDETEKYLSIMSTYLNECYICNYLYEKTKHPRKLSIDYVKYQHGELELTDEQIEIMRLVCEYDVCLLTGGSGTGKSSSMKALVNMLDDNELSYTLVAPTGIASKRLRETTGRKASTIHKTILGGGIIDTDVLVVDEFSMVGVDLFASLLYATADYTKLVLVCDNEQLSSISCGNVLQDIIDTNRIPTSMLTKVFRYGKGGIATVGTDARNGELYLTQDGELGCVNADKITDYKFIQIEDSPLEQIFGEYEHLSEVYKPKDILVLSPFNIGSFGSYAINAKIQAEYNPPKPNDKYVVRKLRDAPNGEIIFRIGDKVINTSNNYSAMTEECITYERIIKQAESAVEDAKEIDGETSDYYYDKFEELKQVMADAPPKASVMNGDMGFVTDIDEQNRLHVQFDDAIIVYSKPELKNLLLGYAISVHKCVAGDTLIYTNIGIQRIKDFVENEDTWDGIPLYVYNGADWEEPSAYYKNTEQDCVKITTERGYSITTSLDHKLHVLTKDRSDVVAQKALSIGCGDYVTLTKAGNAFNDMFSWVDIGEDYYEVTENMGTFVGMMFANGEVDTDCKAIMYHGFNKGMFISAAQGVLSDIQSDYRITSDETCYGRIDSEILVKFCEEIGGINEEDKYIPDAIMNAPKEVVVALLRAMFQESSLSYISKTEIDGITLRVKSVRMAHQIHILLLNLGVISKLIEKKGIVIMDDGIDEFLENVGFKDGVLPQVSIRDENATKNELFKVPSKFISENFMLDKVVNIEYTREETYCLEMPFTHVFAQNGFYGSNCQGTESKAVIMITHPNHEKMLTKNLLYVGLTRAKERLVEVGDVGAISTALTKSENRSRETWLRDLINKKWEVYNTKC